MTCETTLKSATWKNMSLHLTIETNRVKKKWVNFGISKMTMTNRWIKCTLFLDPTSHHHGQTFAVSDKSRAVASDTTHTENEKEF